MTEPIFADRAQAGRRLAMALARYKALHPLVLALPRGGVPVAYEVAGALGADLDLLFVRKLGLPSNAEFALGAVVDGEPPQLVLNEQAMREFAPDPAYVRDEMARQIDEIRRRRRLYVGDRTPESVAGRTVIVVDDGIATGATVRAALKGLRKNRPALIVVAVPVAAREAIAMLRSECDEIVCLAQPMPFQAVGLHYAMFPQTEDDQVIDLLARAELKRKDRIRRGRD